MPATVLQRLSTFDPDGANGLALHEAYRIGADVRHGNSGSQLIDGSGQAIGVVNALALSSSRQGPATAGQATEGQATEGYAITVSELAPDLQAAEAASGAVSTGQCAA